MGKREPIIRPPKVYKPPPLPSITELIAEARELGEDDMADALEKIRHLESPPGQRGKKGGFPGHD